jgi:predicted ArsR family transcriptional regulator
MVRRMSEWTIISKHGLVLAYIYRHPKSTARQIASVMNVTEWTVRQIIADLEQEGYLRRQKAGRNNVYHVNLGRGLRHQTTRHVMLWNLLHVLTEGAFT